MPSVDFPLYLITDRHVVPPGRTLIGQVRAALEGGVRAVQLREKDLPAAELYPLAVELRALTRAFDAQLLINDRIDVALAVAADGVHLGGHSLPTAIARQLLGPQRLLGVSTHHLEEIDAAATAGADFVTYGPIYPTPSKLSFGAPLGVEQLRHACRATGLPLFALGGINETTLPEVIFAGCQHIACIGAILHSDVPQLVAQRLLSQQSVLAKKP